MKFSVEKGVLVNALTPTQRIIDRRTITPILGNVLLEASNDTLVLTATDMDMVFKETIQIVVKEPGTLTLPAHTFYEIVRKLPDGNLVEISEKADTSQVIVNSGKSKFTLPTLPAKDFSALKTSDLPHVFTISSEDLYHLINSTSFAMSSEETRYYLNGIYFHSRKSNDEDVLRAVSTDGHRLALAEIPLPAAASGMPDVIIPRKAVVELSKLLETRKNSIKISLSLTQITFELDGILMTSRLIDGAFPDYDKVIPAQNDNSMLTLNCQLFEKAVDRVSIVTQEKSKGIKLSLESERMMISATSFDQGMGSEELDVHYNGKPLSMGFNARYIIDITQQIFKNQGSRDQIFFFVVDENSPVIIKGAMGDSTLYVLMPMRL